MFGFGLTDAKSKLCLHYVYIKHFRHDCSYDLGQYVCHNFMAAAQFFSFSRLFELRREDTCAMVANPFPATREKVEMASCHGQGGDQEWAHTKVRIIRSAVHQN